MEERRDTRVESSDQPNYEWEFLALDTYRTHPLELYRGRRGGIRNDGFVLRRVGVLTVTMTPYPVKPLMFISNLESRAQRKF